MAAEPESFSKKTHPRNSCPAVPRGIAGRPEFRERMPDCSRRPGWNIRAMPAACAEERCCDPRPRQPVSRVGGRNPAAPSNLDKRRNLDGCLAHWVLQAARFCRATEKIDF